ncbi:DUF3592 domain-containing protein [Roseomonas fluvialis]|uniref:DUF3592 domain-containing protein n=1 Tax=Roseomonas fluvialis TaxID=1750527 RepID=A0ABM7Y4D8_9PROT|nr:DUF3592 domain-containing protein [Roseomonas fluvialis]BDG72768.1 hypothetical protein Rmf_26970 [Roseomonas fluvialis]
MTAAVIAFGLAIALLLHASVTRVKERRLRNRLRPIEARVIDPGRSGQVELGGAATVTTSDDHLPTSSTYYTARWRYSVDGREHHGHTTHSAPVFAEGDVKFGRVQVFYDPENPSFSTALPGHNDQARAWFIAAGIVAVAGVIFLLIGHVTNRPPPAPRGR